MLIWIYIYSKSVNISTENRVLDTETGRNIDLYLKKRSIYNLRLISETGCTRSI